MQNEGFRNRPNFSRAHANLPAASEQYRCGLARQSIKTVAATVPTFDYNNVLNCQADVSSFVHRCHLNFDGVGPRRTHTDWLPLSQGVPELVAVGITFLYVHKDSAVNAYRRDTRGGGRIRNSRWNILPFLEYIIIICAARPPGKRYSDPSVTYSQYSPYGLCSTRITFWMPFSCAHYTRRLFSDRGGCKK